MIPREQGEKNQSAKEKQIAKALEKYRIKDEKKQQKEERKKLERGGDE